MIRLRCALARGGSGELAKLLKRCFWLRMQSAYFRHITRTDETDVLCKSKIPMCGELAGYLFHMMPQLHLFLRLLPRPVLASCHRGLSSAARSPKNSWMNMRRLSAERC